MTIYASPQWKWRGAPEPLTYLCVDNEVRVCPKHGAERSVHVVVPSEFFTLLRTMHDDHDTVRQSGVSFYLDELQDGSWVFGFYVRGTDSYLDLWRYTKSSVPSWALLHR